MEQKLNNITKCLSRYSGFINCHMVEFLTNNLWDQLIPKPIQNEICVNGIDNAFTLMYENNAKYSDKKYQHLSTFLNEINKIQTNNSIAVSFDFFVNKVLNQKLNEPGPGDIFMHFMPDKKIHEVNTMADLSFTLSKYCGVEHIVDIGDGKGYLSSYLSLKYKHNVLGVDSSSINTNSSSKRLQKLQKYWKGLTNDEYVSNSYKQVTEFVTENTNLIEIFEQNFNKPINSIGLVGLHTCGDLAYNSLRLFSSNTNIKYLCNVGCCYHLLNEFPVSTFLKNKNFHLDRNARMLASQSLDRTVNLVKLPSKSLFYRAVFQVYLNNKLGGGVIPGHVGRKCSKLNNFVDYVKSALKNYQIEDIEVNEHELESLLIEYGEWEPKLKLFYLLRMQFAYLIELLILTDRVMYLIENGFHNSHLIKLFEPVISPRHLSIVSIK